MTNKRRRSQEDSDDEDADAFSNTSNGDEDDDEDYSEEEERSEEDDEDDDKESESQTSTLLALCSEGKLNLALRRLEMLQEENKLDILQKEIFEKRSKVWTTALHEVIMSDESEMVDDSRQNLIPKILEIAKQWKGEFLTLMNSKPHGTTALHMAAGNNDSIEILRLLIMANPEALVLKDRYSQTSLEVFRMIHQFYEGPCPEDVQQKLELLESCSKLWTQHRLRLAVYKATVHWFRHNKNMVPFDEKGREETGIALENWFYLSVLGYCLQREQESILWRILNFVGADAEIAGTESSHKRQRPS